MSADKCRELLIIYITSNILNKRSTISIHTKCSVKNKNRLRTIITSTIKPIAIIPNRNIFSKKFIVGLLTGNVNVSLLKIIGQSIQI